MAEDKQWAGVILRIDSPGGDALASDLIWHAHAAALCFLPFYDKGGAAVHADTLPQTRREIQQLRKKKPVIASMGDVAASGACAVVLAGCQQTGSPKVSLSLG